MILKSLLAGLAACAILAGPAVAGQTPSVPGAQAYIISPKDGDVVKGPVKIVFGLKGMGLAPALVEWPKTGHHHVIVDVPVPNGNQPIPKNDGKHYFHFGSGQTEGTLELAPGKHTLRLVLADHQHYSHFPPVVSQTVTITVQ
jgi:hypothetical protein